MSLEEKRKQAFSILNIKEGNRLILSIDGGGVRTTLVLEQLKKIEKLTGLACHELFDMVAGCSAGAVVSGLLLAGLSAHKILDDFQDILNETFKKRSRFSNAILNPPHYTKNAARETLEKIAGKSTTLGEACLRSNLDFMVVAKDVWGGQQTFFSCFQNEGEAIGQYQDILLRSAVEASGSAPLYFTPLERFIDGAVTSFNNPVLPAVMEAIQHGPEDKYCLDKLSIFSFGSGFKPQHIKPKQTGDPPWSDAWFWLMWFLSEAGDDASEVQTRLLRSNRLIKGVDFRRFQLSLDVVAIKSLPDHEIPPGMPGIKADSLHELTEKELQKIAPHNTALFPLMRVLGVAMSEFICQKQNPPYGSDLVDKEGQPMLVTRRGDVRVNIKRLSSHDWLDNQPV